MNQAALETNIPFVIGGYRGTAAEIGPFVRPYQTGCLGCHPKDYNIDEDEIPTSAWINEGVRLRHPNIHFVTSLAANMICSEIFKHLTGLCKPATYNQRYMLFLWTKKRGHVVYWSLIVEISQSYTWNEQTFSNY
jgi:hypothetical protein